jgi:HD-GYP domain-containing protein (c-di-GMP phosphodiesterase class II)
MITRFSSDSSWIDGLDTSVLQRLLNIAYSIAQGADVSSICDTILFEAQAITGAEAGTIFLLDKYDKDPKLHYAIVHNKVLDVTVSGSTKAQLQVDPISLDDAIDDRCVAKYSAVHREVVVVDDIQTHPEFDKGGICVFDWISGIPTRSVISLPLIPNTDEVVGVVQLSNARDSDNQVVPFNRKLVPALEMMCSFAATLLDQRLVIEEQRVLLESLSAETNPQKLLEMILQHAQNVTHADGGTLYLMEENEKGGQLNFALLTNDSLELKMGGVGQPEISLPPVHLYHSNGEENHENIASHVALTGNTININDAYESDLFDFSGVKAFDNKTGYRSKSFLTFPLLNHNKDVIGVMQLINPIDIHTRKTCMFTSNMERMIRGLASYAAIVLNNKILLEDHKGLLDAFIQCIAKAIDAKSRHTSNHCQRVPLLMELMAEAACQDEQVFSDFSLDDNEWYELRVAAWMHDCGKLATPETVLDKATKLHTHLDGIEVVKARFSALMSQIQLDYAKQISDFPEQRFDLEASCECIIAGIRDDLDFVMLSNKGSEFMSFEAQTRIKGIASRQWTNYLGEKENILTEVEVYNLCIQRGTLTAEEREVINNHMVVTIDMLEGLPFPKTLKRVPEYAGGHHERMDGSGFPKGLTREQMSIPARMMAIADVFEALTSQDRPYKDPMKLSVALGILKQMKDSNHIDPELFELFIKARVWEQYAQTELSEPQRDVEDISPYLN